MTLLAEKPKVVNGLASRKPPPFKALLAASEWNRLPDTRELWYVARVVPAREYRAGAELVLRGYRPWLPECVVEAKRRRVIYRHKGPLFPGYVFLAAGMGWLGAEEAPSVIDVIRLGDDRDETPLIVKSGDIAHLVHLIEADGGVLHIEDGCRRKRFAENDPVRISSGIWEGWNGLYKSSVKDRIKILLDVFGRATEMLIPEALVEPA